MSKSESFPDNQRVVVTGIGAVTPLGLNARRSWESLEKGQHGIEPIAMSPLADSPGYEELGAKVVASVPGFELPADFKDLAVKTDRNYLHRSALLGIRAVYEALDQAALLDDKLTVDAAQVDPFDVGLYMGTTFAGLGYSTQAAGNGRLRPSDLFKSLPARTATSVAMQFGTKNPSPMLGWECASGALAIDIAARSLLAYRQDMPPVAKVAVAGGADAPLEIANMRYFGVIDAVTANDNPYTASRPFDKDANGLVMAEGSGALVLETWENAKNRGIQPHQILAELAGYASFTDAASRTKAGIEGAVRAMTQAAQMAKLAVGETVYINAHATSTAEGDPIEADVIQEFIRNNRVKRNEVWVGSTKGATGHTMGAAGAIEAVFSIAALNQNIVPPSRNLESPIDETDGLWLAPAVAKPLKGIDLVISNSLGFGGGVTALAFRKFQE